MANVKLGSHFLSSGNRGMGGKRAGGCGFARMLACMQHLRGEEEKHSTVQILAMWVLLFMCDTNKLCTCQVSESQSHSGNGGDLDISGG